MPSFAIVGLCHGCTLISLVRWAIVGLHYALVGLCTHYALVALRCALIALHCILVGLLRHGWAFVVCRKKGRWWLKKGGGVSNLKETVVVENGQCCVEKRWCQWWLKLWKRWWWLKRSDGVLKTVGGGWKWAALCQKGGGVLKMGGDGWKRVVCPKRWWCGSRMQSL